MKKRSAMKLQQKPQPKQTFIAAATASLFLLVAGFFVTAYVLDWDLGRSQSSQGGGSQNLSSLQSGSWSNGNVWNKGASQQSTGNLFKDNRQELAFNLDTVNFSGGLIKGNKLNAQSLKQCQGNGGNGSGNGNNGKGNGKGNKGGNSGKAGNTSQAICQALGNGSGLDKANDVIQTNDGNYVAVGRSHAFNNNGQLYAVKFSVNPGSNGNNKINKLWETQVGNSQQADEGNAIVQNSNGDFLAVGHAKTNSKDKQSYIVKLDNKGKIQWQRTIGPADKDVANDILITNKGNYLLTGTTKKWGYNSKGIYVVNFKLRSNGQGIVKRWDKVLGAPNKANRGIAAGQLNSGDFAITGHTGYDQNSNQSNGEVFVSRLSEKGNVVWGRTVGNSNLDYPRDLAVDGNAIVVTGDSKASINGNDKESALVLKLDHQGNLQWNTAFRKKDYEAYGRSIAVGNSGNYIVGGYSATPNSSKDAYIAKLSTAGNVIWDEFGGAGSNEKVYGILPRSNGDYLAVGRTNSSNSGNGDLLVANVGSKGAVCGNCSSKSLTSRSKQGLNHFKAVDNGDFLFDSKTVSTQNRSVSSSTQKSKSNCAPFCTGYGGGGDEWFNDVLETSGGYIYVGRSSSFGSGSKNIYAVKVNDSFQVQWEHIIGSSNGYEDAQAITSTSNNDEYLIAGKSGVNSHGNKDLYLVKIKDNGSNITVQQEWLVGGPDDDKSFDLVRLNNGNFVLGGESKSFVNNSDGLLLNFSLGNNLSINWTQFSGSPATNDGIKAITASPNNAITAVAYTDKQNNTGIYTTQYSADGHFRWGTVMGGPNTDKPYGIAQTAKGETIVAGQSKVAGATGTQDAYIAKLDAAGNKEWDKTLGESNGVDRARDVIINKAGNIVFTGGFKDQNTREVYLSILSTFGTELYANEFGGQSLDRGRTLLQSDDNYYVIGGQSQSSTYSSNNNAALATRVNPNGVLKSSNSSGGGSGGSSGSNKPIPKTNDVAVVTKQTILVKNQDHTVGRLQLQNKGKVKVDSGQKLTVEDDLNVGQGTLKVEKGGELVIPDTASIRNIKGTNLTGKISFENSKGTVDSSVFRKQNNKNVQKAAVHGFSSGNDFEAQYKAKNPANQLTGTLAPGLFQISDAEYFEINRTSGNGKARVTIFWNKTSKTNLSQASKNDLVVAHYNTTRQEWENYGRDTIAGKLSGSGFITSKKRSSFSPFATGSSSSNSPLPVELTSFTAKAFQQQVELQWNTASETNNKHFKVQRRTRNAGFQTIGTVAGEGTTIEPQTYQFSDGDPAVGTNYYRLKQVDFDGSYEYSSIKAVDFQESERSADLALKQVSPNPFQRQIQVIYTLPSAKAAQLRLRSVSGEVVDEWNQSGNRGKNTYTARPPQGLPEGTYILSLVTDQNRVIKKLIKR